MKRIIYLLGIFCFSNAIMAQSYYELPDTGTTSEYVFTNLGTPWQGNATGYADTLIQRTLPFTFNFYGKPVTSVKISDNGYVTFDPAETSSNPNNIAVPSVSAPKNAIFAHWDALINVDPDGPSTYTNLVHTWTYGTAPNRVFVIHWFRFFAEPYTTSNVSQYCFGIRLYESGTKNFDIVYDYRYLPSGGTQGTTTATVGIQNEDGSQGIMIGNSPNMNFPTVSSANTDDIVYEFYWGTQNQYDLQMKSVNVPGLCNYQKSNPITGIVRNLGSSSLTSFKIKYLVDGNTTPNAFTVSLSPGQKYNFSVADYIPNVDPGINHNLTIWCDGLNGTIEDQNHSNDTISKTFLVNLGIGTPKRVLIEEFTTVQCGFCPDGHITMENIHENYPDAIGVCHHAGYYTDAMTITAHSTYATAYADGAPTAAIDRHRFEGDAGNIAISRNVWENAVQDRLNVPSPCHIQTYGTFNQGTGKLDFTAKVDFVDYALPGTLRLTVFAVEDHVSGEGTDWDQHSYFYNQTGHPLYHVGNYNGSYATLPKYDHRWVVRAVISPVWGSSNVISTAPGPGESKTKTYSYTIPTTWNTDSVYLVAFVSYYNTDYNKNDVLNSFKIRVKDMPAQAVSIPEKFNSETVQVFPNPFSDLVNVNFDLDKNSVVSVAVYDMLGKKIISTNPLTYSAGQNTIMLNTSELKPGTYFSVINVDGNQITRKLIRY